MCYRIKSNLIKLFRIFYYSLLCEAPLWMSDRVYIAHGAMTFFLNNRVYKVQINRKSVLEDVENRKNIFYNKYPSNKIYIINKSPLIIVSNRLENSAVSNENVIKLLKSIKFYGSKKITNYEECLGVKYGLDALYYYKVGDKNINKIMAILNTLFEKPIRIGKVHGDMHKKNILKFSKDRYVLIDFDCARENDVQAFDGIYYIFEKERNKTLKSWLVFWRLFLRNEDEVLKKYRYFFSNLIDMTFKEAMIILFIERLGQEYKHYEKICRHEVIKVVDEILCLNLYD